MVFVMIEGMLRSLDVVLELPGYKAEIDMGRKRRLDDYRCQATGAGAAGA